jgi:hypothetical protein
MGSARSNRTTVVGARIRMRLSSRHGEHSLVVLG